MLCAPYSVWILQAGRIGPSGVCLVRPPWLGQAILETQRYTTHLLYIHPFLPCILEKDCCVRLEKSTNSLISTQFHVNICAVIMNFVGKVPKGTNLLCSGVTTIPYALKHQTSLDEVANQMRFTSRVSLRN